MVVNISDSPTMLAVWSERKFISLSWTFENVPTQCGLKTMATKHCWLCPGLFSVLEEQEIHFFRVSICQLTVTDS